MTTKKFIFIDETGDPGIKKRWVLQNIFQLEL